MREVPYVSKQRHGVYGIVLAALLTALGDLYLEKMNGGISPHKQETIYYYEDTMKEIDHSLLLEFKAYWKEENDYKGEL